MNALRECAPGSAILADCESVHGGERLRIGLLEGVPDSALSADTPCRDCPLDQLIDHVGGMAMAFTAAAHKDLGELTAQTPGPQPAHLEPGWRARITGDLTALGEAVPSFT